MTSACISNVGQRKNERGGLQSEALSNKKMGHKTVFPLVAKEDNFDERFKAGAKSEKRGNRRQRRLMLGRAKRNRKGIKGRSPLC